MEKFKANILKGFIQAIITLAVLNVFVQLIPYFGVKCPDITTVIVLNSFAFLYLVLTKYVISVTVDPLRKEVRITRFWLFRKTKYIITFAKLRYSYTLATVAKGYRGKTLRFHFDDNILRIPINQLGWNGTRLDSIVHSLEKNKIKRLNRYNSEKDA